MTSVENIISKANELTEYQTVLILGGEPFTYPYLSQLLKGLKKKEVYITTNGGSFGHIDVAEISPYITGINVSIHSFVESENNHILQTKVTFEELKKYINAFQSSGVPVRFNTILLQSGINTKEKMHKMLDFSKSMGIKWVRFSELQFENTGFVYAKDIFEGINNNPYVEGCNQNFVIDGVNVTVRQSCGIVCQMKPFPQEGKQRKNKADSLIMYPNGEIYPGWIVTKNYRINQTDPCEKVIER
jgi:organic radical activating enzyme